MWTALSFAPKPPYCSWAKTALSFAPKPPSLRFRNLGLLCAFYSWAHGVYKRFVNSNLSGRRPPRSCTSRAGGETLRVCQQIQIWIRPRLGLGSCQNLPTSEILGSAWALVERQNISSPFCLIAFLNKILCFVFNARVGESFICSGRSMTK